MWVEGVRDEGWAVEGRRWKEASRWERRKKRELDSHLRKVGAQGCMMCYILTVANPGSWGKRSWPVHALATLRALSGRKRLQLAPHRNALALGAFRLFMLSFQE